MEDGFAREGVLARCNQNRDASDEDVECVNARRAASVLAADEEQAKRSDRAAQSERKLVAMRDRGARAEQAHQQAEAAAEAASDAAYEARWRDAKPPAQQAGDGKSSAPSFGAPIGDKMPSMNEPLARRRDLRGLALAGARAARDRARRRDSAEGGRGAAGSSRSKKALSFRGHSARATRARPRADLRRYFGASSIG